MSFDRGRRGQRGGKDKRDGFGDDSFYGGGGGGDRGGFGGGGVFLQLLQHKDDVVGWFGGDGFGQGADEGTGVS